jgi:YHS domain-containing protein
MRGLFLVAGLVLAFVLLSPMLRGWRPRFLGGGDSNERPDQLVKDPFCGTYVLRSRAFRRESGGEALHFCSADCAARFARGERPV